MCVTGNVLPAVRIQSSGLGFKGRNRGRTEQWSRLQGSKSWTYRVVVSASRVEIVDISTLEDITSTLSKNLWNQMPSDAAAYPRIMDTSSTPLQNPKTSRSLYFVLCNLHKEEY
jgi:hypothetical protein